MQFKKKALLTTAFTYTCTYLLIINKSTTLHNLCRTIRHMAGKQQHVTRLHFDSESHK